MEKERDTQQAEMTPPAETKQPKTERISPMIYIGPSFRDRMLQTYSIAAEGIPTEYRGTVYEKLFVAPKDLHEARLAIARKGSMLHTFYLQALREHKSSE